MFNNNLRVSFDTVTTCFCVLRVSYPTCSHPSCASCLTCCRSPTRLMPYVLSCCTCPVSYLLSCLTCLVLTGSRVSRASCPLVPSVSWALLAFFRTCLESDVPLAKRASVSYVSYVLLYLSCSRDACGSTSMCSCAALPSLTT